MKNNRMQRFICVLFVVCLLIQTTPLVYAVDLINLIPDFSKTPVETLKLDDDCKILRYVDSAVLTKSNHIQRLKEQEKLDTYVFQNRDGTRTVYYMSGPVKFRDADGVVHEKDLTLVEKTGGYGVVRNDTDLLLPHLISEGVDISYEGLNITIYPENINLAAKAGTVDGEAFRYRDCFGNGIDLVYTPTLNGIKEDIVINRYLGKQQFSFLIETDDLRLFQKDGRYYFAGGQNSDDKLWLGDLLIYDAMGKPGTGTMKVTPLEEGRLYRATLSADEKFLLDSDTVYPVTIDPTVQVRVSDETYTGAIQDATVYSNQTSLNTGTWTFNHAGKYDDTYGVGRIVYRLAGLMEGDYAAASAGQVSSVKFYVRDASGNPTSATMNIHAMTSNSSWTETGVTYGNYGSYDTSVVYASAAIGGNNWAEFDITALAKQWKTGSRNPACGMILVNANETSTSFVRSVISSEYGASSSWPYVVATFESTFSMNTTSAEVNIGSTTTISLTSDSAVSWSSSDPAVATVSNGVVTGVRAGTATITATSVSGATASCAITVTFPNGTYNIMHIPTDFYVGTTAVSQANGVRVTSQYINSGQIGAYTQLWYLSYAGNGYYTLTPSFNDKKYLTIFGGAQVSVNESNTNSKQWRILYEDDGYILWNRFYGEYLYLNSGATVGNYIGFSSNPSNDGEKWNLSQGTASKNLLLFDGLTGERLNAGSTAVLDIGGSINAVCAPIGSHNSWLSMTSCSFANFSYTTNTITGTDLGLASVTVSDNCGTSISITLRGILPRSGYEAAYEPDSWNSNQCITFTNCYGYALNRQTDGYELDYSFGTEVQPGYYDDSEINPGTCTAEDIVAAVIADGIAKDKYFSTIGRTDVCPAGTYKVALLVSQSETSETCNDYHFYRQNPDGTWSHKTKNVAVSCVDASGNVIWDPETADHDYTKIDRPHNYNVFVCYFAIEPLNYIISTS